jgi:hypothetical protein
MSASPAVASAPNRIQKYELREVHEDSATTIKGFLSNREGFAGNWDALFSYPWKVKDRPYGYAVFDGDKAAAFIGTMFSERVLANGSKETFCNFTTWFVEEEYRPQRLGLMVLRPVLTMKNVCVTALSPADTTRDILKQFGFLFLDVDQITVPILPGIASLISPGRAGCVLSFEKAEIEKYLGSHEREIFEHHKGLACIHFVVAEKGTGRYCYGIATSTPLGKFRALGARYLNICYLSDSQVFAKNFPSIKWKLWLEGRFVFLRYDARFLPSGLSRFESRTKKARQFKSSTLAPSTIDNLYSELVTFNKY